MAKWQKVITSGSSPELAHVTASGGFNSPGTASFGDITGTVSTATQAKVDHDSLLNFVADEHIAHGGVSVVAGTGLTGGGTIAANRTLNVIGGDGITANANDIAITAAQTTITSIFATDLKIGEDAQTAIDFETADEIHLDAANAQVVNVRAGGIEVTGDVTASAGIHAAAVISGSGFTTPLGTVTAFSGAFSSVSASGTTFATIGTATQAVIDHDSLANFVANEHIDHSAVSVIAGAGLTGGGTIAANRTINVIGGDGITANANDIAITAAQTTITSIFATDLKMGEDAQTAIDFETANEIHLDANNAQVVNVRAGGIEVTGDVTASAGIHAAAVISGSGFVTPLGTVTALSGAFGDVSASGTILAAKLDALAVSDALAAAIVAEIDNDEIPIAKLAEDAVTVTAGTGLTGAGAVTLGNAVTMNVIGGDGITANANDIAITAAQTTITSIFATDLKIGEDAQTAIDFETANEIHLDANNAEVVNVRAGGIEVTGDVTASAGIHAAAVISGSGFTTPLGTVTALSGAFGDVSASGTILAAKLDAAAVSDTLAAAIVAEIDNDEIPIAKLAEDAVTVTAGTGLTGAGAVTLGNAVTMNVIGGDGITANANDIAITAAQTTITSIFATDLKIGEDAQTAIDFETANEIHLDANNAEVVNVRAGGIEVTGDVTASAGIHAAAVISGSGFVTPLGTVTAFSGAFSSVSASGTTFATIGTATQGTIDIHSLSGYVANEHIDHSAVSVVAGAGLTGGGTIAANRTINVIGGDGITANANDIAITAAQTTITSIFATDLKIGEDAQTAIDFETADEIHLDAANAQVVNVRAGGIVVTGDVTASAGISASQFNTVFSPAAALGPGTGSFGHVTASFGGDGSRLINVTAVAINIDGLSALGGTGLHQTQDHFLFSDNGTEKKITFSNLEDAIFGNVSSDVAIAAGGAATVSRIQGVGITAEEATQVAGIGGTTISATQWGYLGALDQAVQTDSDVSFNNVNVDGNLVVAGTASFQETENLNIKDRFISLASGSATGGDGGIVVNQALGNVPSGSAFGYEAGTADRWAVQANFVPTGSSMVPDAYMGIVTFDNSAPSGNPQYGGANYGYGNIHVDANDGDIYIFA